MRYLKWYGSVILTLILLASRTPLHAAEIEVAVGAWQQNPRGSVSYTYNVLDIATKTADGVVHDLIPFDNHLIKQLHNDMEDLVGTLFPGTDANGVIRNWYYQRISRTDADKFRSDAFRKQFIGLSLADFYTRDLASQLTPPSAEGVGDFKATIRGMRKDLIYFDTFILGRAYDKYIPK